MPTPWTALAPFHNFAIDIGIVVHRRTSGFCAHMACLSFIHNELEGTH
jgi:hypothetical protein